MSSSLSVIKRTLLVFWAAWLTIALLTNVADACKAFGLPLRPWPVGSGNYSLLQTLKDRLAAPRWLGDVLFVAVILWQALAAGMFWRAFAGYGPTSTRSKEEVNRAFMGGLGLWATFLVADELFVAHDTGAEASHMRAFTAQLASLLSMHLLPD